MSKYEMYIMASAKIALYIKESKVHLQSRQTDRQTELTVDRRTYGRTDGRAYYVYNQRYIHYCSSVQFVVVVVLMGDGV